MKLDAPSTSGSTLVSAVEPPPQSVRPSRAWMSVREWLLWPIRALVRRTVDNPAAQRSFLGRAALDLAMLVHTRGSVSGRPGMVIVENTSFCNAKCVMCPHATGFERPKSTISDELFERILAEMATEGIPRLQLNGTGEPLLDKTLAEKVRRAKKAGIPETYFYTNGSLMTAATGRRLLEAGLDELRFSVDGMKSGDYEAIRVGLNFETVIGNVLAFLRLRDQLGSPRPTVTVTGYVRASRNELETYDYFREICRLAEHVDMIPFDEGVHSWGGTVATESSHAQMAPDYRLLPCRRLWDHLQVLSDGKVVACCIDNEGVLPMGDLHQSTLMGIWAGEPFQRIRRLHRERRLAEIPLCRDCSSRPSWGTFRRA